MVFESLWQTYTIYLVNQAFGKTYENLSKKLGSNMFSKTWYEQEISNSTVSTSDGPTCKRRTWPLIGTCYHSNTIN